MKHFIWIIAIFGASIVAAEEVGRELNWQTLGASNYVDPAIPPTKNSENGGFKLPSLVSEKADSGAQGTTSLGQTATVFIDSIELVGATVYSDEVLDEVFAPYLNREVSMDELQDLRLALSRRYIDDGYINSGVIIPDQEIDNGHVVLQAIEGSLADITVEGDPKLADRYINSRLKRRIKSPLNIQEVKAALQNLQRDRNVTWIDARLVPGDELGTGVLRLKVVEPPRFEVGVSADNHHSSSAGAEQGRISLKSSNLTGYGEVFRVSAGLSEGSDEYTASFEIPISKYDTKFQTYYSSSNSDIIEKAFEDLDIESASETIGMMITQPFIDTLNHTVSITLGLEVKSSETKLLGEKFSFSPGAQNGEANTAVALLGADWVNRGESHVAALRGTYRRGMDMFDATIFDPQTPLEELSNPTGADGEFDVFVAQGLYIKRLNSFGFMEGLNDRAQLIVRGTAQISNDPLMSLEKLALGGANTVRGYPENLLVRDNGVALTFELQFPVAGYTTTPGFRNLVLAQFIDFGSSWDDTDVDLLSSLRDTDEKRTLVGSGIGIIWEPLRGLKAQIYYSVDAFDNFDDDDPRDSESREDNLQQDGIHFSISYSNVF